MSETPVLLEFDDLQLYARQFEVGAHAAAALEGITVVIDVFRASNTMLELLNAGASVQPVTTVREALEVDGSVIRVGEDEGEIVANFEFDNSPVEIHQHADEFQDRHVVIRTTNGTRGILAATGSDEIIVGTFRNLTAVAKYCADKIRQNRPVNFVAMGTLEKFRIEDAYCAKMFVIKVLELLGETDRIAQLSQQGDNHWLAEWRSEIMEIRGDNPAKYEDYLFSLETDTTDIIPRYNQDNGFLELIPSSEDVLSNNV